MGAARRPRQLMFQKGNDPMRSLTLMFLLVATSSWADQKVVLLFSGPGAAAAQQQVVGELKGRKDLVLIDPAKAQKVLKAKRLSLSKASDREKLARALGADGVLLG